MENLIMLLTASLVMFRSAKKFRPTRIGATGCTVLLPSTVDFEHTRNEEGDQIYYADHYEKDCRYGVICAWLSKPLMAEEASGLLKSYVERLQGPFSAEHSTGVLVTSEPTLTYPVTAMTDYWQDGQGQDWKVKGYTDGRIVSVLFVKNIGEGEIDKQDAFLDSFSFSPITN